MSGLDLEDLDRMRGEWAADGPDAEPPTERFKDEDADTVERREAAWLVKGLWPRVGVCFVVAASGAGKSFWVLSQISKIARGESVLGRRAVECGAVYVAAEGADDARRAHERARR